MSEKIWICEECNKVFTDEEKIKGCDNQDKWGHVCKAHPRSINEYRCEAYLKPYIAA